MLESALGVVRRIDVDALHPTPIERQQGFQRQQVVALNQQAFGVFVAVRRLKAQQVIGYGGGSLDGLGFVDPIE